MKRLFLVVLFVAATFSAAISQDKNSPENITGKTKGMKKHVGFFNFYWEEKTGKVWLEIDKWDEEFLYINSMPAGVGSNDIGLDRGQLGTTHIVKFQRVGPKVFLVQPNYGYRAISDNSAERKAVEEAFAQSILWGFTVSAETNGNVLIDVTDFCFRDAHGVVRTLKNTKQGSYNMDASRSAVYLPRTKNFPQNTEIEVTSTFTGTPAGQYIRQVVPTPSAVTVRQHHSFVKLPDDGYSPRVQDPRSGFWGISFYDYATPISEPLGKKFIGRHRLEKKDPSAKVSEAVEPIVYYLDTGAPEPIRSALLDGARWWRKAFEEIGYKNAFQVKMLPEGADPMDVRYNLIQWVHRSTRGWSYGGGVTDPRTGEIIKGHVILGSLRVRQDFLIAQGLLSPFEKGSDGSPLMQEMALARLRQLSAHEVGHTLGIIHNFAASMNDRASVMDYPHPFVQVKEDGSLDFSKAYGVGVGAWDKAAVAYGYTDFPDGVDETEGLRNILQKTITDGLYYISDQDARPAGGAHPLGHLWDNGTDAAEELDRIMRVRKNAIQRFSENSIQMHTPMSQLEEVLVPLYLSHRYQVDAASKLLGGLYYTYAVRGDGQTVTEIVAPAQQRKALDALLATLTPDALEIPENILRIIPPRAFGHQRGRENFNIRTSLTFDPLAAAEAAAQQTARFLFNHQRAARLIEYHARDSRNPGLVEILDKIINSTIKKDKGEGYKAELGRVADIAVLRALISLTGNVNASSQVRAIASLKLDELEEWTKKAKSKSVEQQAHLKFASAQIKSLRELKYTEPVQLPDGSPIGMEMLCGFSERFN